MANRRPVAKDDVIAFTELDTISGNLLSNDADPDGSPVFLRFFDGWRVSYKERPHYVAEVPGEYGTFTVKPDGSFTYELDLSNEAVRALGPGEKLVEQIGYKISDGLGGTDVGQLRLEIAGAPGGVEYKVIDFEDLPAGSAVPDGYEGFDWGDGWTVVTGIGDDQKPDQHHASPDDRIASIRMEDGADFDLINVVLTGSPTTETRLTAYDDGVVKTHIGLYSGSPFFIDVQWKSIDRVEIEGDVALFDYMTVVVPAP